MKQVLITGGAGFIGLHLAKHLHRAGYGITLADNFSRGVKDAELSDFLGRPGVKFATVDFREANFTELSRDYHQIYHLAAIIGVKNVLSEPYRVLNENVQMLSQILKFAREQRNLERFVFASTSEVYAGTLQHFSMKMPTPETTPLCITGVKEARSSYMLSKIYGEAMCHHSGLPITIIRPHNFYGPRMGLAHVIPELLQKAHQAKAGEDLPVFSVNHQRTFCYIEDAVNLIHRLAESPQAINEAFNIGNESPEVTIGNLAQVVLEVTGKTMKIVPQPETPGSPVRRCPEMKKTFAATSFTPAVSLARGVELTYQWYKSTIFEGGGLSAR